MLCLKLFIISFCCLCYTVYRETQKGRSPSWTQARRKYRCYWRRRFKRYVDCCTLKLYLWQIQYFMVECHIHDKPTMPCGNVLFDCLPIDALFIALTDEFPVVLNTTYTWSNVIMKTWTLDGISVHFLVELGFGSLTNPGKFANIWPHGRGEIFTTNFLLVFAQIRSLTWNAVSAPQERLKWCTLVVTIKATRSGIFLKNGEFFFLSKKSALGSILIFWYPSTLRNLFQKEPLFLSIHTSTEFSKLSPLESVFEKMRPFETFIWCWLTVFSLSGGNR